MKKLSITVKTLSLSFLFIVILGAFSHAGATYRQAQLAEKSGHYEKALQFYRNALSDPATSEAAMIQIATIEDSRLNNPPAALESYRKYLKKFPRGRYTRRAEVRIAHLEPYALVDLKTWHRYSHIKSIENNTQAVSDMESFIRENSKVSYINEARLWLANEYRELIQTRENPKGSYRNLDKAMELYRLIVKEEKKGQVRIAAMKNLGDCYLIQKEYGKARLWYDKTLAEGGDYGRRLIGKYSFVTNIHTYRLRTVYVIIFLIPLLLGFLAWLLPVKEFSFEGLKMGAKHALMFLPGAVFITAVTFALTDASKDNITGSEPWLVLVIMATTLVTLLANGLVLEAEEREKISFGPYLAALFLLIVSIDYLVFFQLNLLHYFETLITG